jgi:TRAP-type C4-dicarboxylate transport system substrate-binding protein
MELGGKAWDLVYQVKQGKVDLIWTAAAYTPELFRRTQVFTLPLVHKGDAVATSLAIAKMLGVELRKDYLGLKPLLVHVHSGHVFHTTKAIRGLDDFKGLTIRAPGKKTGLWTVEELGASPTKKRHPSLPVAMKHGLLDGALMSPALALSMGVMDTAKHHFIWGEGGSFGTSLYMLLMNEKRYNSLPGDLRAMIDESAGEKLAIRAGRIWQKAGEAALAAARRAKHETASIRPDEKGRFHVALTRVLARWARFLNPRSIEGLELINTARSAIAASEKQLAGK